MCPGCCDLVTGQWSLPTRDYMLQLPLVTLAKIEEKYNFLCHLDTSWEINLATW